VNYPIEKPEITEILNLATQAFGQQDWTSVNRMLQQLPVDRSGKLLLFSTSEDSNLSLNLAIAILQWGDFQQQWEVAKFLPKFGQIAVKPLVKLIENVNEEIETRWFAARILADLNTVDSVLALVELLKKTEEEELSSIAVQSLANMGKIAIDTLSNLLGDDSLRLSAVTALSSIRRSETIVPLLQVVDDKNDKIRVLTIEALGSFHDPRIPPILIKALKDLQAIVRKEAVAALGMRADLAAELNLAEIIAPLLYDLNPEVCRQAALSLGRIGTETAAAALFKVFQSSFTPVWLKLDLVRSLAWNGTETALECLKMSFENGEVEICREVIVVLGRTRDDRLRDKACTILLEFFETSNGQCLNPQIKQALAMSLGQLGDKRAIETLSILAKDDDRSVSLHAAAALKASVNLATVIQKTD
jgi:HEAT repeat protein